MRTGTLRRASKMENRSAILSFLGERIPPPSPPPPSSLRETSKLKDPPVYIDLISIPRNWYRNTIR